MHDRCPVSPSFGTTLPRSIDFLSTGRVWYVDVYRFAMCFFSSSSFDFTLCSAFVRCSFSSHSRVFINRNTLYCALLGLGLSNLICFFFCIHMICICLSFRYSFKRKQENKHVDLLSSGINVTERKNTFESIEFYVFENEWRVHCTGYTPLLHTAVHIWFDVCCSLSCFVPNWSLLPLQNSQNRVHFRVVKRLASGLTSTITVSTICNEIIIIIIISQ